MFMEQREKYYLKTGRASDLAGKKDWFVYRFFEIIPGFIAWLTLIGVVILSFKSPTFMALFIIVFDVYWLVKTIYLSLHLRVAFSRVRQNLKIDWRQKLEGLSPSQYTPSVKSWQDIYHLVILPMYNEDVDLVEASFGGLLRGNYPKNRMIVVLALEERAGQEFNQMIEESITRHYTNSFLMLYFTRHPSNITGEMAGKGSNIAWAGKKAKEEIIDKLKIPYDHVLVSAFDVDTVINPEYFGILTHTFLTSPDPLRASYQPVPFYTNNIWEAPAFARVVAFSATFWHTIKQERFETATTFSSHSMPFRALVDVGFWQNNMVSEDSRIFWQCFLHYDGNYRVQSLYYPVSMDANVAPTFWQTMVNVYKQQRRWGYGAENVPYFLFGFLKNRLIPWTKKLRYGFMIIESFWSWATNAIILFLLGWLPVTVGGAIFNRTVLSYNLPYLTRLIMTFAMVGLISSAVLSIFILPPKPPKFGRLKYAWMILQWLLFPLSTIVLGALPGLEAQTRLMFARYMGFWVTPKLRKNRL